MFVQYATSHVRLKRILLWMLIFLDRFGNVWLHHYAFIDSPNIVLNLLLSFIPFFSYCKWCKKYIKINEFIGIQNRHFINYKCILFNGCLLLPIICLILQRSLLNYFKYIITQLSAYLNINENNFKESNKGQFTFYIQKIYFSCFCYHEVSAFMCQDYHFVCYH